MTSFLVSLQLGFRHTQGLSMPWVLSIVLLTTPGLWAEDVVLFKHTPSKDPRRAALKIDIGTRSSQAVKPFLYGKFTEHLGQNIYNGIDAQILMNPTFGKWVFSAGDNLVDGGASVESDIEKISRQVQGHGRWLGLGNTTTLLEDYKDGGAFGWMRLGKKEQIHLSPDVGPAGKRAQRIEILKASANQLQGLVQWTYLPLHRTRQFEFRLVARATIPVKVRLSLAPVEAGKKVGAVLASRTLALTKEWSTQTGKLELPSQASIQPGGLYAFAITLSEPANVALDRVLLYPSDHVNFADPDVIRFLKEARLPLMRWPGGNFVSGYHWRNGVGPVDLRPTLPNPAWGGLEYNFFGTDEFLALCKAIGCEPMICLNAGDGTPEEAAAWVEYCNGSTSTPLGRMRAANGHPEPYRIKYWEIGNEVFGRWQIGWTTPAGNVDRFLRFSQALKAADPSIEVLACGNQTFEGNRWNGQLIADASSQLSFITDHILTGGPVDSTTDPNELFQASLGYAVQLGREYRGLRRRMLAGGVQSPRLAITELQLFAYLRHETNKESKPGALTPDTMPSNKTITEALYDATIIHECIRMGDFAEMLTHSATVNHGGGLQKRKERVWADPSHYGHEIGIALAGAVPVAVTLESATYSTSRAFADIRPMKDIPVLDAMAVLSADESVLTLMMVHRSGNSGPIQLSIDPGEFKAASQAELVTLAGDTMYAKNTLEEPEKVKPRASLLKLQGGTGRLVLPPYSLTRITLKRAQH